MARTDNITNFLTDIASAIKTKTGYTGQIKASEFDTKISEIETGSTIIGTSSTATAQSNMSKGDPISDIPNITVVSTVTPLTSEYSANTSSYAHMDIAEILANGWLVLFAYDDTANLYLVGTNFTVSEPLATFTVSNCGSNPVKLLRGKGHNFIVALQDSRLNKTNLYSVDIYLNGDPAESVSLGTVSVTSNTGIAGLYYGTKKYLVIGGSTTLFVIIDDDNNFVTYDITYTGLTSSRFPQLLPGGSNELYLICADVTSESSRLCLFNLWLSEESVFCSTGMANTEALPQGSLGYLSATVINETKILVAFADVDNNVYISMIDSIPGKGLTFDYTTESAFLHIGQYNNITAIKVQKLYNDDIILAILDGVQNGTQTLHYLSLEVDIKSIYKYGKAYVFKNIETIKTITGLWHRYYPSLDIISDNHSNYFAYCLGNPTTDSTVNKHTIFFDKFTKDTGSNIIKESGRPITGIADVDAVPGDTITYTRLI